MQKIDLPSFANRYPSGVAAPQVDTLKFITSYISRTIVLPSYPGLGSQFMNTLILFNIYKQHSNKDQLILIRLLVQPVFPEWPIFHRSTSIGPFRYWYFFLIKHSYLSQ